MTMNAVRFKYVVRDTNDFMEYLYLIERLTDATITTDLRDKMGHDPEYVELACELDGNTGGLIILGARCVGEEAWDEQCRRLA